VVVLALLGDPPDPALDPALRRAVATHAARWAARHAGSGLAFASTLVDGAQDADVRPFSEPAPEDAAAALAEALDGHEGPVLLVGPDVPRLDDDLAAAALGDLAAGSGFAFAPATDGRPFLLALARADAQHLALVGGRDRHRDEVFALAAGLGGDVGLLRSARRLVTPADARALAVDPVVAKDLRDLARSG
jgi:hypothetical protein